MRRIAFLCGLCLLMTGAVASGAPLIGAWVRDSAAGRGSTRPLGRSSVRGLVVHRGGVKRAGGNHAAQVVLLGERALGSTVGDNLAGTVEGFAFRARRSGRAASISVYLDARDRATTLFAGLYSSRGGHPGSLLISGSLRSPRAGVWNSVAVRSGRMRSGRMRSGGTLRFGRTYWLAVLGRGGAVYFRDRDGGSCVGSGSSERKLQALPRSWPAGPNSQPCQISAYVRGTAAGRGASATTVFGTNAPAAGGTPAGNGAGATAPGSAAPAAPGADLTLPPVSTGAPAISGSPLVGQTLAGSIGSWIDSPTSYAYQWEDCDTLGLLCTAVSGATSSSYTLAGSDVGDTIRVVVTATNAGGSTPATSAQTATVTSPPAPSNSGVPVVSGSAQQGDVLTTSNGSWSGSPTSYAYQWQDCNGSGASLFGYFGGDVE